MKRFDADVDIDVDPALDKTQFGQRAMIYDSENQSVRPHPSGLYRNQQMPVDPVTGLSAIDYKDAEEAGFMKIDLLSNSSVQHFKSKQELSECLNQEPDWSLLHQGQYRSKLPHVANHGDIIDAVEPKCIEDLADVLALIRPGKRELLDEYMEDKKRVRKNLYRRPKQGHYFKKSHAISYAFMIVAVLNKISNRSVVKF